MALKTNYKDDILNVNENTERHYQMVNNSDGTVSLNDVTQYTQVGDTFGAKDINATNLAVKQLSENLAGCWSSFTDAEGNPTTKPYIHWNEEVGETT